MTAEEQAALAVDLAFGTGSVATFVLAAWWIWRERGRGARLWALLCDWFDELRR